MLHPPKNELLTADPDPALRQYLASFKASKLLRNISRFRSLNFRSMSDSTYRAEFDRVLMVNTKSYVLPIHHHYIPHGTKLFRVRKIPKNDRHLPFQAMSMESDAWAPPAILVQNSGRLHKKNEPLLYTADHGITAFLEARIAPKELAALIIFETKMDLTLTRIGINPITSGMTKEEAKKLTLVSNFIRDEFSRKVGKNTEHFYRGAEIITKDLHDIPLSQGWAYSSVQEQKGTNYCFRPDAGKDSLQMLGVLFASYDLPDRDRPYAVYMSASAETDESLLVYHPLGSEFQLQVFPEISAPERPSALPLKWPND